MKAPTIARRSWGFTLLELIVVITIIGILGTLVVVRVAGWTKKAQMTKIDTDLKTIYRAAEMYYATLGYYPDTVEELKSGKDADGNDVGVEITETKDPWGNEYDYQLLDGKPVILCYGKDGVEGGEGDNKDYQYPEGESTEF